MQVRRLEAGDAELLREVRLAALADSPGAFTSTFAAEEDAPAEFWRHRASESADGRTRIVFVAVDEHRPLGMIGAYAPDEEDPNHCVVWGMWVSPACRRHGVGSQLLEAVISWAQEQRLSAVHLSVTDAVPAARMFYQRLGFEQAGPATSVDDGSSRTETPMRLTLTATPSGPALPPPG